MRTPDPNTILLSRRQAEVLAALVDDGQVVGTIESSFLSSRVGGVVNQPVDIRITVNLSKKGLLVLLEKSGGVAWYGPSPIAAETLAAYRERNK